MRPAPPKKKPPLLRQAAFFSLYAPFVLLFISALIGYGIPSDSLWHHYAVVVYTIVYRVTIVVAFAFGVVGFIGGIKHRCIEIYVCAFWGCFFNGVLLALLIISFFNRLFS